MIFIFVLSNMGLVFSDNVFSTQNMQCNNCPTIKTANRLIIKL